jgi:short-subunit dehydrogenase
MLRFNALSLKRQLHTSIQANSLENKTALVTGASRGIGLAIAESFAMYGTKVILVSHNEDRAKQREADFISRFGSGHQSIAMDISKRSLVMEILKVILTMRIQCLPMYKLNSCRKN